MARIRMIKPEFFDDPVTADLSAMARLFFIALWTQADREGRLEDEPRRLKARIFPYDDAVDVHVLAVELHDKDMIRRYTGADGKAYIWIRNFSKHQRPHPKEPASLIPPCENGAGKLLGKSGKNTAGRGKTFPASKLRYTESGTRNLDQQTSSVDRAKGSPDPRVRAFLTWFRTEYQQRRHGADYLVKWAKHGALAKQMLGATDLDKLKIYAQILLSDKTDEDFIVQTDRGIANLAAKFSWLWDRD